MKNIIKYASILLFFGICIGFSACEEKPVVVPEFVPIETQKVMLVEELTGVKCPNCPAGSARLESISKDYPGNIVVVGIHGIDLAKPLDESKYDFRNDDAADLEVFLRPFLGKPAAYFNRIKYADLNGDFGNVFQGQWQALVEDELNKDQVLDVFLNKSYDPVTRQLSLNISAIPLVDIPGGEFKVTIMITESNIEDAQDDQFVVVDDYIHNHVLRDVVTTFSGDFYASELKEGEAVEKPYTYTVPDDQPGLWIEENLEVIAFIAMTEGDSEEVLQAVTEHLMD